MDSHIACNTVMPGSGGGVMTSSLDVVLLESEAVHHNIVTGDGGAAVLEESPGLTMTNVIATCNATLLDSVSGMIMAPESLLLAQAKHIRAVGHSAGKQGGARVLMEPSACTNKYNTHRPACRRWYWLQGAEARGARRSVWHGTAWAASVSVVTPGSLG